MFRVLYLTLQPGLDLPDEIFVVANACSQLQQIVFSTVRPKFCHTVVLLYFTCVNLLMK